MVTRSLVDAFVAGARGATAGMHDPSVALERLLSRGRAAWPGLDVDASDFGRHVGERLARGSVLADLEAADAEGLYIACACTAGDQRAIELLERVLVHEAARSLSRMGVDSCHHNDLLSELREEMFFPRPSGAPPLVAGYAGRGTIRAWVRTVAIRKALVVRRRHRRTEPTDEFLALPTGQADPEVEYLKRYCLSEFRQAMARAMTVLLTRERSLLRMHYLDGLGLDEIAKAYRVHRATAARWIADARDRLLERTKAELRDATSMRPSELESVLSFVRGQSSFGAQMADVARLLRRRGRR
jgi:RNA polymerase sigma-70 factor (ECF subfamily)